MRYGISIETPLILFFSGIDVVGILGKMGIELSSVAGGASTMVIAYAVHKVSKNSVTKLLS